MYVIGKTFEFSAWHSLPDLPSGHQCRNRHGHNYQVTLVLQAKEVDGSGFVVDYGDMAITKEWLDAMFDHQDDGLNRHLKQPSAENLARFIYEHIRSYHNIGTWLHTVVVKETPNVMAAYSAVGQPVVWSR